MLIETTVYIKTELLDLISYKASLLGIKRNEFVLYLLGSTRYWKKDRIRSFLSVCYQKSKPTGGWKRLHIALEADLYEKCLDMRKIFKMSVSLILACVIEENLEKLTEELTGKIPPEISDNYPHNYLFLFRISDQFEGYFIFWGFPGEKTVNELLDMNY